jgi:hypothetical protein
MSIYTILSSGGMSRSVLAVLLVGVLALVYCTSCSSGPIADGIKSLKAKITGTSGMTNAFTRKSTSGSADPLSEGMTVAESARVVQKLGNVFNREDTLRDGSAYTSGTPGDAYDPINMGALKQTEIDAHKRGLSDMTPFNSYGPSGPNKTIRDDDEYMRNTGVPWVGGRPRTVKKVASGPQAGARQVTSASEKDIYQTHIISATEPTWG